MRVKKRDFVRQFSKYLKVPGMYELESCGEIDCVVVIKKSVDSPSVEFAPSVEKVIKREVKEIVYTYGCGCKKEDKLLCPRHGRY